ncbi:MAG: restriction endonuclease subunit S [Planctomycetes bacterium]|nr:restriction endonuclease subunit S [Planctomycetota bacterium]
MNADRLLEHFGRISDAPDAVPRLRRFILDLAVRGKLVEQDTSVEPASELLERIQAEKALLIESGELRRHAELEEMSVADTPFVLPAGWEWVRLIDLLTKLTDGTHHSPPNHPQGDFKYITAKNIKPEGVSLDNITYIDAATHNEIYSRCNPEKGDILYIKDGATTGVVTINTLDEPFSLLSSVALLKLAKGVYNSLVVAFLRSPFFYEQMRSFMKGAAITRLTLKRMAPALIPLPPLAEQYRIVAKVEELMGLCDQLEAAQAKRERRRDRLTAAALAQLNVATPTASGSTECPDALPSLRTAAAFVLDHLPRLTTRPQHIQQLRQTILNLAVRGQLISQDPNDEPAKLLFDRIKAARAALVVERRIRQSDDVEYSLQDELNDAPPGWVGAYVNDVAIIQGGKRLPNGAGFSETPTSHYYIRVTDMKNGTISETGLKYISSGVQAEIARYIINKEDLYITIAGTIGAVGSIPESLDGQNLTENAAKIVFRGIDGRFFLLTLRSDFVQAQFLEKTKQMAQPKLALKRIAGAKFYFPPLAEQHRIVAKVDELMALCDGLEAQLSTTHTDSRRLLEAVLQEALAPVA